MKSGKTLSLPALVTYIWILALDYHVKLVGTRCQCFIAMRKSYCAQCSVLWYAS